MKKIFNKWYFSFILIPIIINLITAEFEASNFINNWELTIIGILLIYSFISFYELSRAKTVIKELKSIPNARDKRIVNELISTLDVVDFEENVYKQNSWYGYPQRAIRKTLNFSEKAFSEEYKTSDEKLNELIQNFAQLLYNFNSYAGSKLFNEGNFYIPAKENEHNLKIAEEATPIMNQMTKNAFANLQELLKYLRRKRYLI